MGLPKRMKAVFKFFLFLISLVVTAVLVLRFSEISLPQCGLEYLSRKLSSEDWLIRMDSVKWSFPGKIGINGLRMLNRKKPEAKPFLSAENISCRLSLTRFPWSMKRIMRSVVIQKLKMPRLPDGYYIPDSIEFPGSTDFKECNEPLLLEIPELKSFKLTLIDPDILDLKARDNVLKFDNVHIIFPDRDAKMELNGECELNIQDQRVRGSVHGQARQNNIRPMLQALDITNSYQFVDAFTGVTTPVDAGCKFEVNLRNADL